MVILMFISDIFEEAPIAWNTHLSQRTISYLAYEAIVFITIENR